MSTWTTWPSITEIDELNAEAAQAAQAAADEAAAAGPRPCTPHLAPGDLCSTCWTDHTEKRNA